ncbi:hypothetical protein BGLA2_490028 [Burkholderia gladioli]|nr:hypothetical protein BGLA2_490028 [Burkholderia gladioli]
MRIALRADDVIPAGCGKLRRIVKTLGGRAQQNFRVVRLFLTIRNFAALHPCRLAHPRQISLSVQQCATPFCPHGPALQCVPC